MRPSQFGTGGRTVERVPSEDRGRLPQFIPIRFILTRMTFPAGVQQLFRVELGQSWIGLIPESESADHCNGQQR